MKSLTWIVSQICEYAEAKVENTAPIINVLLQIWPTFCRKMKRQRSTTALHIFIPCLES